MNRFKVTKWLLSTAILSMSLLTVMAGAAIAPALGVIQEHFKASDPVLIQMLVSVPAVSIIFTTYWFPNMCKRFTSRFLVLFSLLLYVVAGTAAFFIRDLYVILLLRALLGVSVGIMMPLSTGLLAFYFDADKQAKLMGLSSSMNYLGGVIATLIAGALANIHWNYSFLVYLMGLMALVLCMFYLPSSKLPVRPGKTFSISSMKRYGKYLAGMLLVMPVFFIYPTNFALLAVQDHTISPWTVAPIMAILDVFAFYMGIKFFVLFKRFGGKTYFFPPLFYMLGYAVLLASPGYFAVIIGSALVGVGAGLGIPLIYATASQAGGKEATTTVMPLLSAAMYLGQFLTPILVSWSKNLFLWSDHKAYWLALLLTFILLLYAFGMADVRKKKI